MTDGRAIEEAFDGPMGATCRPLPAEADGTHLNPQSPTRPPQMLLTPTVQYAALIVAALGRLSIENLEKSLMRIPNRSRASGIAA